MDKDSIVQVMSARRFTLRKQEKLRHKSVISSLFEKGESVVDYPLRLYWINLADDELRNSFRDKVPPRFGKLQMLITVPKKKRRHAVDRVLMRRRIREAYRLNRHELADVIIERPAIGVVALAFIYMDTDNIPFSKIEKKMKSLLAKVKTKIENSERIEKPGKI